MNPEGGTCQADRLTERGDVSAVTGTMQIGQMDCCNICIGGI